MKNREQHTFALHCPTLAPHVSWAPGSSVTVADQHLWHRVTNVLRLQAGEKIILFSNDFHAEVSLEAATFTKKNILHIIVNSVSKNEPLKPAITLMPALLKKEAFEAVAYVAAQMGATTLQPLLTQKVQRVWGGAKERERLTNIMVAAAEQSKNFVLPIIQEPLPIAQIARSSQTMSLYFEDTGQPFMSVAHQVTSVKPESIQLVFGPEGGLTADEQQQLADLGFVSCALTPTILRAQEAITVGLGLMRSLLGR